MAFHFQTFKTRALTAIVFVVVMLLGLLTNVWSFFLLFAIINIGAWYEYFKLVGKIDASYLGISVFHKVIVVLFGLGLMAYFFSYSYWFAENINMQTIGWWVLCICGIAFPLKEFVFSTQKNAKVVAYSFLGLLYISLSLGLLINLRTIYTPYNELINGKTELGFIIPLILIASIWINDTMAYIVGSFIGKTPFSSISPKKTWEGTIGGALLCVIIIGFLIAPALAGNQYKTLLQNVNIHLNIHWFVIAAIAAVFGTLGDLLESKLKRLANVKDSGSFMPGHGGFLDRFDSLLVATPFVWVYVHFFM